MLEALINWNSWDQYQEWTFQACLIATPTFTHEGYILGSLEGGKAVFSEKPIAEAPSGTIRCYQKSHEVGKPLFCAFNRRFDPSFSSVKARVEAGEVGHVQMIKTTSRDSPLPSLAYLKIRFEKYTIFLTRFFLFTPTCERNLVFSLLDTCLNWSI